MVRSRVSAVLTFAGAIVLATAGAAQAAVPAAGSALKTEHRAVSYSVTWHFRSRAIHRCVTLRATGTVKYAETKMPNPHDPPPEIAFTSIKLTNPRLSATVYHYGKGRCGSRERLTKISIGQHWTGYSCSYNPTLSVSYPWGISVSAWPSCGDRRQAHYSTGYGRGSYYRQSNSGSPTRFGNDTIDYQASAPCYGITASTVAYVGSRSDSYGASNGSASRKVCLKK